MINNSYTNAPSFGASLKINGFKLGSAKKLNEVKQFFAQKTQHYADDVLDLTCTMNRNDSGRFFYTAEASVNGCDTGNMLTGDFKTFYKNNSPEDIAKSLVRIFKYNKASQKFSAQINSISKNIRSSIASSIRNTEKALLTDNTSVSRKAQLVADSSAKRVEALKEERTAIKAKSDSILNKIQDNPIFDIFVL